jgi:DNA-binding PadR family transcriptional regulator
MYRVPRYAASRGGRHDALADERMSAVFSHGRLRLYLLKLLSEGPRHGYELIRLLENRFLGLYAPSAGTIYPRLARMEADGLVTHTAAGARKVYEITDAGHAELRARAAELATLEHEVHESVAGLSTRASEVEPGVRDRRRELRQAGRVTRPPGRLWPGPATAQPEPARGAADELERHAERLLAEVRRLAHRGQAGTDALRTAAVVVDTALDQVRRLLR